MIKRILTFVSGVQESILVNFISQTKVKTLHKVKTCQNCLHQKFPYKNEQIHVFLYFFNFRAAIIILSAVLFDFKLLKQLQW